MLTTLSLRGVEGITRVFMREPKRETVDPVTGAIKMLSEWVLDTEGVNLQARGALSLPPLSFTCPQLYLPSALPALSLTCPQP